jgi:hypothetical protein
MKLQLIAQCNDGRATVEELEYLYDHDMQITFETFARYVDIAAISAMLGYSFGRQRGLKLRDDYAVQFYRSKFRGKPCYHLDWSDIDHIFQ